MAKMFRRAEFFTSVLSILIVSTMLQGCAGTHSSYFLTPRLTEERARAIRVGMTDAEVRAAIGEPHQRVRFDNLRATAWDYRYIDTWGYVTDFAVMMGDNARVQSVVVKRVEPVDR